ncbi:hypothetical protein CLU79DRAFT_734324 [Phycomyces nitens]|nr:hypothetical protein CLU79DRAFT_734324 [Phycomyces nitens]
MTAEKLISISNDCFVCERTDLVTLQHFRRHLLSHGLHLPGRALGERYKNTSTITYIPLVKKQSRPDVHVHHGCPSCVEHFSEMKDLKAHVEIHLPNTIKDNDGPRFSRSKRLKQFVPAKVPKVISGLEDAQQYSEPRRAKKLVPENMPQKTTNGLEEPQQSNEPRRAKKAVSENMPQKTTNGLEELQQSSDLKRSKQLVPENMPRKSTHGHEEHHKSSEPKRLKMIVSESVSRKVINELEEPQRRSEPKRLKMIVSENLPRKSKSDLEEPQKSSEHKRLKTTPENIPRKTTSVLGESQKISEPKSLKTKPENIPRKTTNNFEESRQNSEPKRVKTISLSCGKTTLDFHPATIKDCSSEQFRLPHETIKELEPVVTILADYNTDLPRDLREIVNQELDEQSNLKTLNSYPCAFELLRSSLEQPLESLPNFLWSYSTSPSLPKDEKKLIRVIQFILTEFAGTCYRNPVFNCKSDCTFLIDRVIPLFQTLENQTGLLGFEWCDVALDEEAEADEKSGEDDSDEALSYHDGIGYDYSEKPVLIINNTLCEDNELAARARDDILKNLHSSIHFLSNILRNSQFAKFTTLCKAQTFSIQVIDKVMIFSTVSLHPTEPGGYIYKERRSAEIPESFADRMGWIRMFELLATLIDDIDAQKLVTKNIATENSGVYPIDKDETGRAVIFKNM